MLTTWQGLAKTGFGRQASLWLVWTELERTHGSTETCIRTFRQALQCVADYPEAVCQAFQQFVREKGTLADIDAANQRFMDSVSL